MFEFCDNERKCELYHVILLWISKFSNIFCDIIDSIFMQFNCKKFIKYVNAIWNAENNREIDKKKVYRCKKCKIEFFDLIKICQKNKSINIRKNQIFSTLFVFFDRVSVLQNRFCFAKSKCNDCIIRFFETISCDFKSYLYNTFFRNYIVWLHRISNV